MSLSCSCDFDPSDYNWYWVDHSGFKLMGVRNRRKRCCSCKELINSNSEVMEFYRYRATKNDIEERIHGEEISLANSFMCEECAGLFLALDELGYGCLDISQPMKDYVAEYNEMGGKLMYLTIGQEQYEIDCEFEYQPAIPGSRDEVGQLNEPNEPSYVSISSVKARYDGEWHPINLPAAEIKVLEAEILEGIEA